MGGLEWSEVKPCIEEALHSLEDVRIVVYEPQEKFAEKKSVRNRKVPNITPGRAALVELMRRYLAVNRDPYITLPELHNLMYFMQEAGEPLKLKYTKAQFGPYAENLRHVLNAIEGHLISGYDDGVDKPGKELKLVPGAVEDVKEYLKEHSETSKRAEKVANLVEGFEDSSDLELFATVHWLLKKKSIQTLDELVNHTHEWNERKEG